MADLLSFPRRNALNSDEGSAAADRILVTSPRERVARAAELHLEDPEQLLSLCQRLRERLEATPKVVHEEASFFYRFLDKPVRRIGSFDEREYYLGELALIAGTACRVLSLGEQAVRWFDRSEACFVLTHSSSAHFARLAYQKLALRLQDRNFEAVLELAPMWSEDFQRMSLPEDSLKCRCLEAIALKETDRFEEAETLFQRIHDEAEELKLDTLAAVAAQNLFQIYAFLGQSGKAVASSTKALSVFRRLGNRVGIAKLNLGVGYLLRNEQRLGDAIEAYRSAQAEFGEIGMHADVAATHLVLADLLLDANQPAQAEWEIRAALPVIDELKLVPEGIAALSLLRDSMRRRQIDRQALRSLNGYFEELGGS